eukprot:TRINITY_DN938_c0_g1_i13.p1 TRINITY_DN938_c0_g1~~TRINITY_DN938_c0_g1_i13.p1  ORF type:complete len:330 (-),score=73.33 TRINITY_DN938_c0_g1_i13:59-1048(-)
MAAVRSGSMLPGLLRRAAQSSQATNHGARRSMSGPPAAPALWSAVHGMFDADVPLTEPFPGVPTPTPRERPPVSPVRVTKLDNGARVASVDTGDRVSSVGLFVRAGSRYESAGANTGVCSLLEHMAFRGSARRSKFLQTRSLEKTGASFGASASREVLIYSAEGMRAAAGSLVGEIAEAALEPMVMGLTQGTPEWDAARAEIKTQAAAMADHPELSAGDASVELNELLHATAYNSVGLGMTSLPKATSRATVAPDVVASYVSASHTPRAHGARRLQRRPRYARRTRTKAPRVRPRRRRRTSRVSRPLHGRLGAVRVCPRVRRRPRCDRL